jgi:hypothetical protein
MIFCKAIICSLEPELSGLPDIMPEYIRKIMGTIFKTNKKLEFK